MTIKKYANKGIKLFLNHIHIPSTEVVYNREYPWSASCKECVAKQSVDVNILTGEVRTVTNSEGSEEVRGYSIEEFLKKCSVAESADQDTILLDLRTYQKEFVTEQLGEIFYTAQELFLNDELDASKKKSIFCYHPCSMLIKELEIKQRKYDGYYYDSKGTLVAFDDELRNERAGLVMRKDYLDEFLKKKNLRLIWFIDARKVVNDEPTIKPSCMKWTGILEYTGKSVEGEYYIPH